PRLLREERAHRRGVERIQQVERAAVIDLRRGGDAATAAQPLLAVEAEARSGHRSHQARLRAGSEHDIRQLRPLALARLLLEPRLNAAIALAQLEAAEQRELP